MFMPPARKPFLKKRTPARPRKLMKERARIAKGINAAADRAKKEEDNKKKADEARIKRERKAAEKLKNAEEKKAKAELLTAKTAHIKAKDEFRQVRREMRNIEARAGAEQPKPADRHERRLQKLKNKTELLEERAKQKQLKDEIKGKPKPPVEGDTLAPPPQKKPNFLQKQVKKYFGRKENNFAEQSMPAGAGPARKRRSFFDRIRGRGRENYTQEEQEAIRKVRDIMSAQNPGLTEVHAHINALKQMLRGHHAGKEQLFDALKRLEGFEFKIKERARVMAEVESLHTRGDALSGENSEPDLQAVKIAIGDITKLKENPFLTDTDKNGLGLLETKLFRKQGSIEHAERTAFEIFSESNRLLRGNNPITPEDAALMKSKAETALSDSNLTPKTKQVLEQAHRDWANREILYEKFEEWSGLRNSELSEAEIKSVIGEIKNANLPSNATQREIVWKYRAKLYWEGELRRITEGEEAAASAQRKEEEAEPVVEGEVAVEQEAAVEAEVEEDDKSKDEVPSGKKKSDSSIKSLLEYAEQSLETAKRGEFSKNSLEIIAMQLTNRLSNPETPKEFLGQLKEILPKVNAQIKKMEDSERNQRIAEEIFGEKEKAESSSAPKTPHGKMPESPPIDPVSALLDRGVSLLSLSHNAEALKKLIADFKEEIGRQRELENDSGVKNLENYLRIIEGAQEEISEVDNFENPFEKSIIRGEEPTAPEFGPDLEEQAKQGEFPEFDEIPDPEFTEEELSNIELPGEENAWENENPFREAEINEGEAGAPEASDFDLDIDDISIGPEKEEKINNFEQEKKSTTAVREPKEIKGEPVEEVIGEAMEEGEIPAEIQKIISKRDELLAKESLNGQELWSFFGEVYERGQTIAAKTFDELIGKIPEGERKDTRTMFENLRREE